MSSGNFQSSNLVLYDHSLITLLSPSCFLQNFNLAVPPHYAQFLFQLDELKYFRIGKFYDYKNNKQQLCNEVFKEIREKSSKQLKLDITDEEKNEQISSFSMLLLKLFSTIYSIEIFIYKKKFSRACLMKNEPNSQALISFIVYITDSNETRTLYKKLLERNEEDEADPTLTHLIDVFLQSSIQFELLYFSNINENTIELQSFYRESSLERENIISGEFETIKSLVVLSLLNAYYN